jgi:hypothetical protein
MVATATSWSSQENIPGTVLLVDVDHVSRSEHLENGDIVLVPTPSQDLNDPLNWSKARKVLAIVCTSLYVTVFHSSIPQNHARG